MNVHKNARSRPASREVLAKRVCEQAGRCARRRSVYAATDDFTRLCYVGSLDDERSEAASTCLERAVSWFAHQNIRSERVMTDNGSAFISR